MYLKQCNMSDVCYLDVIFVLFVPFSVILCYFGGFRDLSGKGEVCVMWMIIVVWMTCVLLSHVRVICSRFVSDS